MGTAEAVLVCALTVLGRSAASFPPVQFVDVAASDVTSSAEAFVRADDRHIYIVTTSRLFSGLQRLANPCGDLDAVRKLASVLVHEETHVRGAGEAEAYSAQLTTLASLGAGPGTPVFTEVRRSMRHVTASHRTRPELVMVAR